MSKNLVALVPDELHTKLKIQLAKDGKNYKDWVTQQIKDYVEGAKWNGL